MLLKNDTDSAAWTYRVLAPCQTNTDPKSRPCPNDGPFSTRDVPGVKVNKSKAILPIGRTAQIAFQIEALRAECCAAAKILMEEAPLNEAELDECARLDDALSKAQATLKSTVANVMITRLRRRSRVN